MTRSTPDTMVASHPDPVPGLIRQCKKSNGNNCRGIIKSVAVTSHSFMFQLSMVHGVSVVKCLAKYSSRSLEDRFLSALKCSFIHAFQTRPEMTWCKCTLLALGAFKLGPGAL